MSDNELVTFINLIQTISNEVMSYGLFLDGKTLEIYVPKNG